jgi:hypothetical protein
MDRLRVKILDRIDQLRYDLVVGQERELQKLEGEYNRIIKETYDNTHGVSSDILDIFPSEVWIQIIKESLPSSGYAPALLLLTMVSNKWRNALIATPTLWAHIEIRGSENDSLATIETFLHLSRETPLLLSIYAPPRHDLASIRNILASIGSRLREVIVKLEADQLWLPTQEILQVFELLLSLSDYIPGVRRIQLETGSKLPLHDPEIAGVIRNMPSPPNLRQVRGWCFNWREMHMGQHSTEYLERIDSFHPLEDVIASQMQLPELRSLNIIRDPWITPADGMRQEGLPYLPNLTQLTYRHAYRSAIIVLLQSVATNLRTLDLRIPLNKVDLVLPCLEVTTRLEQLLLRVDEWYDHVDEGENKYISAVRRYPDPTCKMPHLRHLELDVFLPNAHAEDRTVQAQELPDRIIRRLMATFMMLYKYVEHAEFDIDYSDILLPLTFEYISELPRLKVLRVESTIENVYNRPLPSLVLPPLEVLNTGSTELLRNLRPPTIHFLRFDWGSYCEDDAMLNGIDAQKVWITADASSGAVIQFPRDSFPFLAELTISIDATAVSSIYSGLRLNSFSFLSTITILAEIYTQYATELCLELLYNPDSCPSLDHLRFPTYPPDWDILFIMLETRNFMANGAISRIRRITVPFISHHLRSPLVALLRGLFTSRPRNEDLLLGGNLECLLDDQV